MSQPISDIIDITISRDAASVAKTDFGVIMLIDEFDPGSSPPFSGRTKSYTTLAEMGTDGYATGDYAYDSAAKIFAQNPKVSSIKVGAKFITSTPDATWTAAINAIRAADSAWYGFTILSTTLADQKEVADLAQTLTDPPVIFLIRSADSDIVDITAPTEGYQTITNTGSLLTFGALVVAALPTQTDYELDVTVDGTLYQLDDISVDIADDWNDIAAAIETSLQTATSSTETCVILGGIIKITSVTTGETSTILIAAGTAGTGSGDILAAIDAIAPGTTYATNIVAAVAGKEDIAYYIENLSYNRSSVWYHPTAATNYIDAAAMGERFPKPAAVGTWMFKTLVGIATYSLTTTQRSNSRTKYANIYIERASIDMSEEGWVGNGRFLDEERGIDQLTAWIQEDLFELLVGLEKEPYNNDGINQVGGKIEYSLGRGTTNIINNDYTVTVPDLSATLLADRQLRDLKGVEFDATLQGAIHHIFINGSVTI